MSHDRVIDNFRNSKRVANMSYLGRGEEAPNPTPSALLRNLPVLVRTEFVLTKDQKRPYKGQFCGKVDKVSCSKAAGALSKDEIGP